MQTYTAHEMLSPQNSKLLDDVILLMSYGFTEDIVHRWLLNERDRKAYVAALPIFFRFIALLALQSDASVIVVNRNNSESTAAPAKDAKDTSHETKPQLRIRLPADFQVQAIAITIPPHGNAKFDSTWTAIRAGVVPLLFKLGFNFSRRFFEFVTGLSKLYDECYPDPAMKHTHYHLLYITAHPDSRGQGLGKKILQELQNVVTADNARGSQTAIATGRKHIPPTLYLEASSVDSKRLYTRVGFELQSTFAYGELDQGEDLRLAADGAVLGGREFGMVWTPKAHTPVEALGQ